ncbi:MAG TPA: UvrD-helicase domain-containing protein [Patescibacteria group bacterium]
MIDALLKQLNPDQQKAVLHTDGPMIILAGAGSGKTRVLTYKVIYLMLEKNIQSENILMVTFTNKAANEMKERIEKFLPNRSKPLIATFHSLCSKILRIEGKLIGLSSSYVIYDTQDQLEAIKEAMNTLSISPKEYKPAAILGTISQAKNELLTASEYGSYAKGHFQEVVSAVYSLYQNILKENNAVDFDDLILQTTLLFQKNPEVLEKYQKRFQYILVDEYQDTNRAQYVLTKLLAQKWQNICVVGDFSQSIYSWRGADFKNLSKFQVDFKNVQTFELAQNYRSTQKILDAASSVIKRNSSHPVLELWTENPHGEDVTIYEARNEQDEANYIINYIKNYGEANLKDIAVLYRTNAQSRVLEEVFLHHGIPYILVGGTKFYERKEIKDVLSYLRLIANSKDSIAQKRIEKLGKGRYEKFLAFLGTVSPEFKQPTIELMDNVMFATGYLDVYDDKDEEDAARLENIKELRSVALSFPDLTQFLENVSLVEQESMPDKSLNPDEKNAVTFMTLHAAKGLEFPVVFMVGMEEGLFPHSRSLMDRNELEEERRLAYVGMTRAKKKLFMSYAKRRLFFGQRTSNIISRFLLELPEEVLQNSLTGGSEFEDDAPEYL